MRNRTGSKTLIVFTVLFFALCGSGKSQSPGNSLVGVWQDSKVLASGWSNTFIFFNDGTYKFCYNQMDCSKRVVSFYGKWWVKKSKLKLMLTQRTIIEGGRLEPSTGSCASDSMIVGGTEKTLEVTPPEKIVFSVSRVHVDNEDDIQRLKVYIDNVSYWKFSDNPDELFK